MLESRLPKAGTLQVEGAALVEWNLGEGEMTVTGWSRAGPARDDSPLSVTDFTIKNLKHGVEDAAPKFGMAPDVEARFASKAMEASRLGISYQRLAPNARLPFGHKHAAQEEIYVVLEGSGRVKLDDELREVTQWDAVRVGPDTVRCFEAGPDGLALLVVGAPYEGARADPRLVG